MSGSIGSGLGYWLKTSKNTRQYFKVLDWESRGLHSGPLGTCTRRVTYPLHNGGHILYWCLCSVYCKSNNFRDKFIFAKSVKRYICHATNFATRARVTYISIRQSDLPFCESFFSETSHLRSFAKIKHSRKFPNSQYLTRCVVGWSESVPFYCHTL